MAGGPPLYGLVSSSERLSPAPSRFSSSSTVPFHPAPRGLASADPPPNPHLFLQPEAALTARHEVAAPRGVAQLWRGQDVAAHSQLSASPHFRNQAMILFQDRSLLMDRQQIVHSMSANHQNANRTHAAQQDAPCARSGSNSNALHLPLTPASGSVPAAQCKLTSSISRGHTTSQMPVKSVPSASASNAPVHTSDKGAVASEAQHPPASKPLNATSGPTVPPVQRSILYPSRIKIKLDPPYGVQTKDGLVVDKRVMTMHLEVVDSNGVQCAGDIGLQVKLVYEDCTELPVEVQAKALGGTTATLVKGSGTMRLRVMICSSAFNKRRFRLQVTPQDEKLAKVFPTLKESTEPFTSLNSTDRLLGKTKGPPKPTNTANVSFASTSSLANEETKGPSSSNTDSITSMAALLSRKRYFPAAELHECISTSCTSLSKPATGMCDRLAAIVVQQLTKRAWMQARRRSGPGRPSSLQPDDVVGAIKKPGNFDFLHHYGVFNHSEDGSTLSSTLSAPIPQSCAPPQGSSSPTAPDILANQFSCG